MRPARPDAHDKDTPVTVTADAVRHQHRAAAIPCYESASRGARGPSALVRLPGVPSGACWALFTASESLNLISGSQPVNLKEEDSIFSGKRESSSEVRFILSEKQALETESVFSGVVPGAVREFRQSRFTPPPQGRAGWGRGCPHQPRGVGLRAPTRARAVGEQAVSVGLGLVSMSSPSAASGGAGAEGPVCPVWGVPGPLHPQGTPVIFWSSASSTSGAQSCLRGAASPGERAEKGAFVLSNRRS